MMNIVLDTNCLLMFIIFGLSQPILTMTSSWIVPLKPTQNISSPKTIITMFSAIPNSPKSRLLISTSF